MIEVPSWDDFTALRNSITADPQTTVELTAAVGRGGEVYLPVGTFTLTEPLVVPAHTTLRGSGQATILRAAADMPALVQVGDGKTVTDGVDISGLTLDCDGKAEVGLAVAQGRDNAKTYQGEPDSCGRYSYLWVYDSAAAGIELTGTGQAGVFEVVRVRRAGKHAWHVAAPDNKFALCEGTTRNGAGWRLDGNASNCTFTNCSAWSCDDDGWYIKSTRNTFQGCDAADTGGHSWHVVWGTDNLLSSCRAETPGNPDSGGTIGTADGFVVDDPAAVLVGCLTYDRQPGGKPISGRYGFNTPGGMAADHLVACVSRNLPNHTR